MPYIINKGVRIHYEIHGQGTPIALAYGLGGTTDAWRHQVAEFSQGYQLILWDPRGHGRSDSPSSINQYGPDISASDLLVLLDYLRMPKAFVGGQSAGATIAAKFTLAHPERVLALLIADSRSASGLPMSPESKDIWQRTIQIAEEDGKDAVIRFSMDVMGGLGRPGTVFANIWEKSM